MCSATGPAGVVRRRASSAAAACLLGLGMVACAPAGDGGEGFTTMSESAAAAPVASGESAEPLSAPAVEKRTITAAGLQREFILSLPAGARQRARLPLIMVFHGYRENAETIHSYTELDKADAVVAYMQGKDDAWAPAPYAGTTGEQDLAFVDAVRSQLSGEFRIDPARVFAAGLSNGGGFTAYVGCQRPQDFTAVATVSAAFYQRVSDGCSRIPIKQIDFHGTADAVMNYAGGERHNTVYDSTPEMTAEAAERNRCRPQPVERRVADTVVEERWEDCDAGLEHFRIEGGPHVWPGGLQDDSGTAPKSFATDEILDFFRVKHRRPS